MTTFTFPLRVDIATGEKLDPTGLDPRSLRWVQGAALTVPGRVRREYAEQQADLVEKLAVLRAKRPAKLEGDVEPAYGPRRRPLGFRRLQGRPLPEEGLV
jgi:hypothetical protein